MFPKSKGSKNTFRLGGNDRLVGEKSKTMCCPEKFGIPQRIGFFSLIQLNFFSSHLISNYNGCKLLGQLVIVYNNNKKGVYFNYIFTTYYMLHIASELKADVLGHKGFHPVIPNVLKVEMTSL